MNQTRKQDKAERQKDIFTNRYVIIGVILASLLMPLLMGCGVKGDLKRPATAQSQGK